MTNPTRKRVVTLDDLNVLNQNAAYARQKGEEASAAAQQADTARQNLEELAGDTQAAGQQATQAAQAATLAKNSATAAALQASQAAGDAVTAAELAEGAAGTANQAAGAATTAAQRVTDAVLDLSGLKDDLAPAVEAVPDVLAGAAAAPDAIAGAAAKPDAQAAAALLPPLQQQKTTGDALLGQVQTELQRLGAFTPVSYPGGYFVSGYKLVLGFADDAGRVAFGVTDTGKMVILGGIEITGAIVADALSLIGALTLAQGTITSLTATTLNATNTSSSAPVYVQGERVARIMEQDDAGNVLRAYLADGRTLLPGGLVLPNQTLNFASGAVDVLTTRQLIATAGASSATYVQGRKVARVLYDDDAGNILGAFDDTGALVIPGGIIAPNIGDTPLPVGYTVDADGVPRIAGRRTLQQAKLRLIGDSMVDGDWGQYLTSYGETRPYVIEAQGGASSTSIAVRVGATPVFTTAGVTVPAGGVEVEFVPSVLWLTGSGNRSMSVTYGGVTYTVRHHNHNSDGSLNQGQPYFIKRADGGAETVIPAFGHLKVVLPAADRAEYIPILWMYRNNFGSTDAVVRDVQSVVQQHLRASGGGKFLVIGTLMGVNEPVGGSAQNTMDVTAAALAREFGTSFQDPRAWMVAGDPGTSISGGLPSSLSSDGIHLTTAGKQRLAQFVALRLKALGI
ncbi:hypothetical protein [Deinococcus sp. ME38]|uniref:hypothetical protein n=1 Tax=Deinococcus sp. ME38 TaxID=3400344 RepID=UPI003B5CB2B0